MLYLHGQQLRSCRGGQSSLLHYSLQGSIILATILGQASQRQITSTLCTLLSLLTDKINVLLELVQEEE